MIRHDDMTKGDTLILWNGHRVTYTGQSYIDAAGFEPRTMVGIRFTSEVGEIEMSIDVRSVVGIEGKAVQMELWG